MQLTADNACAIFDRPERPAVCRGLMPSAEMCGDDRDHALAWLGAMEASTRPAESP